MTDTNQQQPLNYRFQTCDKHIKSAMGFNLFECSSTSYAWDSGVTVHHMIKLDKKMNEKNK